MPETIDYSKVLWSHDRETDKIFCVRKAMLTILAGQTNSSGVLLGHYTVLGTSKTGPGIAYAAKKVAYFRNGSVWMPISSINAAATINGISVSEQSLGALGTEYSAFASTSAGVDRTVELLVLYMPTTKATYNSGGVDYTLETGAVVPINEATPPKIKWSSFDRQATVAGSTIVRFNRSGASRTVATIPHNLTTRPTVRYSSHMIVNPSGPGQEQLWSNDFSYLYIRKDNTNIYVDYDDRFNDNSDVGIQVWWYNE